MGLNHEKAFAKKKKEKKKKKKGISIRKVQSSAEYYSDCTYLIKETKYRSLFGPCPVDQQFSCAWKS